VLSTPRDEGKQGIRHNNQIKALNIMIGFQSTTSYYEVLISWGGSKIKVKYAASHGTKEIKQRTLFLFK
jgi:hypothetical protein